jgi:hypothetical protein
MFHNHQSPSTHAATQAAGGGCEEQTASSFRASNKPEQKNSDSLNKEKSSLSNTPVCKLSPTYSPATFWLQLGRTAVVRVTPLRLRGELFTHDQLTSHAHVGSAGSGDPWSGGIAPKQCSMTIEITTTEAVVSSVGQVSITESTVQSDGPVEGMTEWSSLQLEVKAGKALEPSGACAGTCNFTASSHGGCGGVEARVQSDWSRVILGLRDSLIASRVSSSVAEGESECKQSLRTRLRARELFYKEFQRLSLSAATKTLQIWGWQGDLHHDAEEVASECVVNLIKQEAQGKGIFLAPVEELPQYLSGVIWRGVRQRIGERQGQSARLWRQVPLEVISASVADGKVSNVLLKISMEAAIEKVANEERRTYNLPEGVVPLDGVLDKAVAQAIVGKVPKRSWQRYVRKSRLRLGEELGMW